MIANNQRQFWSTHQQILTRKIQCNGLGSKLYGDVTRISQYSCKFSLWSIAIVVVNAWWKTACYPDVYLPDVYLIYLLI
jgi:hypothetical protein